MDARKHYNISELPVFNRANPNSTSVTNIFGILNKLSEKRGATKSELNALIEAASIDWQTYYVVDCIVSKTLRCGVGAKTINDVMPNFIEIFPYMQCSSIGKIDNIKYPAFVQEKLNGEYVCIIIKDNSIKYRTRNGSYLELLNKFDKCLLDNISEDLVLCGEILVNDNSGKYLSREKSNGIISKAINGTITELDIAYIDIVLWDVISLDEFYGKVKPHRKYLKRFSDLYNICNTINNNQLKIVENVSVLTKDDAIAFFEEKLVEEKEGAILKDIDAVFKNGKSTYQIKLKQIKTCELEVVSVNKGKVNSKYEFCMGSITCKSKDGDLIVDVGSGFTDKERGFIGFDSNGKPIKSFEESAEKYWESKIGKIVEVKFNTIIQDKTKKYSLYLPIFSIDRKDKNEADTLIKIKGL